MIKVAITSIQFLVLLITWLQFMLKNMISILYGNDFTRTIKYSDHSKIHLKTKEEFMKALVADKFNIYKNRKYSP